MTANIKVPRSLSRLVVATNVGARRSTMFEGNERKQREHEMKEAGRLPPGQALTLKWPVLHYGSVPGFDPATWDFKIWGAVAESVRVDWREFGKLPRMQVTRDFHCVTRWSRFDNLWEGVTFRD